MSPEHTSLETNSPEIEPAPRPTPETEPITTVKDLIVFLEGNRAFREADELRDRTNVAELRLSAIELREVETARALQLVADALQNDQPLLDLLTTHPELAETQLSIPFSPPTISLEPIEEPTTTGMPGTPEEEPTTDQETIYQADTLEIDSGTDEEHPLLSRLYEKHPKLQPLVVKHPALRTLFTQSDLWHEEYGGTYLPNQVLIQAIVRKDGDVVASSSRYASWQYFRKIYAQHIKAQKIGTSTVYTPSEVAEILIIFSENGGRTYTITSNPNHTFTPTEIKKK